MHLISVRELKYGGGDGGHETGRRRLETFWSENRNRRDNFGELRLDGRYVNIKIKIGKIGC